MSKPQTFSRNLTFWTLHGIIAAAPSFIFASISGWNTLAAYCAMILGVVCIILAYTLASSFGILRLYTPNSRLSAILRWAAHIRAGYALISLLGFLRGLQALLVLDFFCGSFGVAASEGLLKTLGFPSGYNWNSSSYRADLTFLQTWLSTIFTGVAFSVVFFLGLLLVYVLYGLSCLVLKARPSSKDSAL